ncbi:SRPBCC family protein [Streptomyces albidoflavus]|uniref:SRPBCC family protein n=2 Tax=Streptomyces TaxID=1883 RepID=UPI00226F6CAB|nr:cyclase [Streptomyces albidoflavus]
MTRFELETRIAAPVPLVFGLSLDVDAHTASMARSGERAVAGVTSGAMALGDTVTWRARHFGVVWRMTSRITAYDHPTHFVDEQTAGPFHHWWHAHHFTPDGHGGTLMRDEITFQAPLGPLGRLAERAVLDRYMPHLMRERNAHLRAVAEREAGGAPGAGWVGVTWGAEDAEYAEEDPEAEPGGMPGDRLTSRQRARRAVGRAG